MERNLALLKMTSSKQTDVNSNTFAFDKLTHNPIRSYIGEEENYMLYVLATDPKYSSVTKASKFDVYDAIMGARGFRRFHIGTNRIVYRHAFDPRFLIKIGLDAIGISDNLAEMRNQEILKPFIPKVFDVTPDGVIQMCERVYPFTKKEDYIENRYAIFDTIQCLLKGGRLLLEDIGTNFFMNWGYRPNFGPVVLDFPYVYVRNNDRMRCIAPKKDKSGLCNGLIDYDAGYNELICQECGQRYAAKDIGSDPRYLIDRELAKQKISDKEAFIMNSVVFNVVKNGEVIDTKTTAVDGFGTDVAVSILDSKAIGEHREIPVHVNPNQQERPHISVVKQTISVKQHHRNKDNRKKEVKTVSVNVKAPNNNRVGGEELLADIVKNAAKHYPDIKSFIDYIYEFDKELDSIRVRLAPNVYAYLKNKVGVIKQNANIISEDNLNRVFKSGYHVEDCGKVKATFVKDGTKFASNVSNVETEHPETKEILKHIYNNEFTLFGNAFSIDYDYLSKKIDKILDKENLTKEEMAKELFKELDGDNNGRMELFMTFPAIRYEVLENVIKDSFNDIKKDN